VDITKQPAPHKVELAITETIQNATSAGNGPAEIKWPGKVTAAWLWKHMPLSAYAVIGGTFLAGVMVGNWEPIKQLFLLTTFRRKNRIDVGVAFRGSGRKRSPPRRLRRWSGMVGPAR
jgi:hypothetical protein